MTSKILTIEIPDDFDEYDCSTILWNCNTTIANIKSNKEEEKMCQRILEDDDAFKTFVQNTLMPQKDWHWNSDVKNTKPLIACIVRASTYGEVTAKKLTPNYYRYEFDMFRHHYEDARRPIHMLGSIHSMWYGRGKEYGRGKFSNFINRWRRLTKYTCLHEEKYIEDLNSFRHRLDQKRYGPPWWGNKALIVFDDDRVHLIRNYNSVWINGKFFYGLDHNRYQTLLELYDQIKQIDGQRKVRNPKQ